MAISPARITPPIFLPWLSTSLGYGLFIVILLMLNLHHQMGMCQCIPCVMIIQVFDLLLTLEISRMRKISISTSLEGRIKELTAGISQELKTQCKSIINSNTASLHLDKP